jgi:hypothetical protein
MEYHGIPTSSLPVGMQYFIPTLIADYGEVFLMASFATREKNTGRN